MRPQVFVRFKELADVKKGITDEDIVALAGDESNQPAIIWDLTHLQVPPLLPTADFWQQKSERLLTAKQWKGQPVLATKTVTASCYIEGQSFNLMRQSSRNASSIIGKTLWPWPCSLLLLTLFSLPCTHLITGDLSDCPNKCTWDFKHQRFGACLSG